MALIEKEPIMKFIEDGINNKHYGYVGVEIITQVEFAPTVDAVPVVRCKDCKHWGMYSAPPETERVKCCSYGQYFVGENGYCVYGEVKDDD